VLVVSPAPRKSRQGGTIPGKFEARLGERLIVEASRTPFCDGARVLLAQGLAAPGDLLIMRHAGSGCDALTAAVGVAAGLTVKEETADGKPRFVSWQPHPRGQPNDQGVAPMRETEPPVPLPSATIAARAANLAGENEEAEPEVSDPPSGPVGLPGLVPPVLAGTGPAA
jgi:hypothetical protein